MSTEYPTISSVKPLMYKLLEKVLKVEDSDSSISKQMKEIKSDLAERYQSSELKTVLNVTTFLDPCYKELPFVTVTKRKYLNKLRRNSLTCTAPAITAHKIIKAATGDSEPPAKKSRSKVL